MDKLEISDMICCVALLLWFSGLVFGVAFDSWPNAAGILKASGGFGLGALFLKFADL